MVGPEADQEVVDKGTALARPRMALAVRVGLCIRLGPSPVVPPVPADVPHLALHGLALVPALGLAPLAPVWAAQVV